MSTLNLPLCCPDDFTPRILLPTIEPGRCLSVIRLYMPGVIGSVVIEECDLQRYPCFKAYIQGPNECAQFTSVDEVNLSPIRILLRDFIDRHQDFVDTNAQSLGHMRLSAPRMRLEETAARVFHALEVAKIFQADGSAWFGGPMDLTDALFALRKISRYPLAPDSGVTAKAIAVVLKHERIPFAVDREVPRVFSWATGEWVDLDRQPWLYLRTMYDRPNVWISGSEMAEIEPDLLALAVNRKSGNLKSKLPAYVQKHIEAKPGKGQRLIPSGAARR